jgi:hypothetical protein
MTPAFMAYFPTLSGLLGLAAVLLVAAVLAGAGAGAARGCYSLAVQFVSGWGLLLIVATVFGVVTAWPLTWALFPVLAIGLLALVRLFDRFDWREAARMLLLGSPLLLVVAAASASQWDEFAHWLVNQRYLVEVGTFPRQGLPESTTVFAAYPYGLAVIGFLASRLAGGFVENAGALLNTLLIILLALLLMQAFRDSRKAETGPPSWGAAALALLGAGILNPAFVPKIVFTTYADWTTAVVLACAVAAAWRIIDIRQADDDRDVGKDSALHLGLALAVLVSLKQSNAVLVALLLIAVAGALVVFRPLPMTTACRLVPRVIFPVLIIYAAWRYHVVTQLPGREFTFLPFESWLWSDLGSVFQRMLLIASKKGGYFGLMLLATSVGAYAGLRALSRRPVGRLGRLAFLMAALFVGYNAFLYVAYIGAFDPGEARGAASYWRYNTQLGGAGLLFAAAALGEGYRRYGAGHSLGPRAEAVLAIIALALPLALSPKIRFDLNPVTRYVRSVGIEMSDLLPANALLAVVDPSDNGKRSLVLRYELRSPSVKVQRATGSDLRQATASATHAWVHVPSSAIVEVFAVPMAPRTSYLLAREGARWRIVRSWPYPGYSDPASEDD